MIYQEMTLQTTCIYIEQETQYVYSDAVQYFDICIGIAVSLLGLLLKHI